MSQQENSSRDKRWSLQGMTALVTGGTKGLGYAIVGELAALGAIVHTCGRSQDQLSENIREWKAKGFKVTGSVCDLSSNAEREKLMEEVSSFFDGKLDILINNAGGNIHKGTLDYTTEDFVSIMNINLGSAFHLSQLAHPLLKASGAGRIVFMSSIASVVSINPQYPIYSATKGAMNQLTRNLACEWAKDNIRVNAVAPWSVRTPLTEQVWTTGTMGELTPAVKIDGREVGDGQVGPVTRRLQNAYKKLTEESGVPIPSNQEN
ncbi:tropinone reductase homolog At2g29170-like isoform X4 [Populus trichocarpa]|uniref:tropinone reductase homolog At2g29170-like isoform X4 n=1 Tax=Populus trichocarpa TaxID=3694 RepID=UPI0022774BA6|nr:tropinone reductase homolog At2g29170-like isoform X4 [Populus trichocarpa]